MAGRWNELVAVPPRGFAAGRDGLLIFKGLRPAIRPAPSAPRRGHGRRFAMTEHAHADRSSRVAASIKCRISRSYFCREQSRQSEGIAVAMARVANAVIGKKNKTWCEGFMLAATPDGGRRAVRSYSPWRMPWFCAGARAARPRPPVRGASAGRLHRAENHRHRRRLIPLPSLAQRRSLSDFCAAKIVSK